MRMYFAHSMTVQADGRDSIINTSSVVTFRGSGTMIDYAATKGAIVGFTRSLAVHLIPKGIRVNAVASVILSLVIYGN